MKSATTGISTSTTEVSDISPFGVWLLHRGEEFFLPHDDYPWFKDAPVSSVFHVVAESYDHVRWPELDVDLSLESIQNPHAYPLVFEKDEPSS